MKKLMAVVLVGVLGCGGGGDDDGGGADAPGGGGDGAGGGADSAGPGIDAGPAVTTLCSTFPATLTTGPTIAPTQTGAVMCMADVPACYVTSNTYSDGEGACGNADTAFFFYIDDGSRGFNIPNAKDWTAVSTSHGTTTAYGVQGLPDATDITVVVSDGTTSYDLAFRFDGADITFTSFAPQS